MNSTAPPKLQESSIDLLPLTEFHSNGLLGLWSDHDAVKLTNWPYLTTLPECNDRLKKVLEYYSRPEQFGAFVIRSNLEPFLGIVGVDLSNSEAREFEVWYFVDRNHRGRGVAKAALAKFLLLLRESRKVKSVIATAVTINQSSWRVLESSGFKIVQTIEGGFTKHNQKLDLYFYRLSIEP